HAKVFQTNALGTWFHPNSHQNLVAADRLFLSVCRNMHSYGAVGLLFQTLCPGVLENLAPMLRDCPLHDFDAVRIDTRKQPGGEFNHGKFGPEGLVDHAQFQPDHSAPNDHQFARELTKTDRLARADDGLAVEFKPGHLNSGGSGGDDDAFRGGDTFLSAGFECHLNSVATDELSTPFKQIGPIRFE